MLNILLTEQISLSDCRCLFFLYDQKVKTKIKISWKELLRFKKKHLFIIFKGFSLKQIKQIFFLEGKSLTLRLWHFAWSLHYRIWTKYRDMWKMVNVYVDILTRKLHVPAYSTQCGFIIPFVENVPIKKTLQYNTDTGQLPCSFGKALVSNELLFGLKWVLNFYLISIIIFPFTFCFGNSKNLINTV